MHYPDGLLPTGWLVFLHACGWPVIAWSAWRAQWWRLGNLQDLRVWLGATLFVTLLWQVRAGIDPGLEFHLIGTTVLTLMFGRHFAVISVSLATVATILSGTDSLASFPVSVLLLGVIPARLSWLAWRIVERHLANNLFVYIFITGFFGAALCAICARLCNALLAWAAGVYDWDYLAEFYLPFALMMGFPEAFVSGTLITMLTVLKPQWLLTFRDSRYLR